MSVSFEQTRLIAPDVKLGHNVRIFGFTTRDGWEIEGDSSMGTFVEIQKGARIGRRCKVSSHTFICEGVTLEDEVFVGHGVMFTNDKYPRSTTADGRLQTGADWQCLPTVVKARVSIGSGATILCGLTLRAGAVIGGGGGVA